MMVKKKRPDEEESGMENHVETPENKENIKIDDQPEEISELSEQEADDECVPGQEEKLSDNVASVENELNVKLAEMQDKYIRLSAEFDNYRKRTLREKMDMSKYAHENMLLKLLPVMDDFDRALSHMESSTECTSIKNGIDLIYIKFSEFLKHNGVREIDTTDSVFNVDLHDAVAKVAVPEDEKKGKIIDVIQKGYYLNDKVIRHSKVVIGE